MVINQIHPVARVIECHEFCQQPPAPQCDLPPTKVILNNSDVGGRTRTNKAKRSILMAHGLSNNGNHAIGSPISQSITSPIKSEFGGSIQGRKRSQKAAGGKGSPESGENWEEQDESRIGVKRACNECRQQKARQKASIPRPKQGGRQQLIEYRQLRCDVIQEPFKICSRCARCNLECRIDSNFKRIGKRKKNAEMEREIVELRNQLASQQSSPSVQQPGAGFGVSNSPISPPVLQLQSSLDQYMGSQEAVASLLDLRSGLDGGSLMRSPNGQARPLRRLESVIIPPDRVDDMFRTQVP